MTHALRLLISALLFTLTGGAAPAADFGYGSGTAVIVLRSPKAIFAAVDSKETDRLYTNGKLTVSDRLMCKVAKVGPYYSIVTGTSRATSGFDALQEVASAYTPGDDLEKLVSAVRESVPHTLAPVLKTMREVDPAMFAANYVVPGALQLTLMGSEHNSPKVVVVEFQAAITAADTIALTTRTQSCPGDCSNPRTGYFLGVHEEMEQAVRNNPAILSRPDQDQVEKLIHLEYDSRPDVVGGPISTLKIGPSGSTVLRSGVCALD
jgi:hypothetical protein